MRQIALTTADLLIIAAYLGILIFIGIYLKKQASKKISEFL
jgi:hypothetical protein